MTEPMSAQVFIRAPVSEVFALVADSSRHPLWVHGVSSISDQGKLHVGKRYTTHVSVTGRSLEMQCEVLAVETNSRVEIATVASDVTVTISYLMRSGGGGTIVSCFLETSTEHPLLGLAKPMFDALGHARIDGDLQNLKALAESGRKP